MKILALAALVALTEPAPPQTDIAMEDALAKLPKLTALCGEVPEAPTNVRRYNPIKPLQKSVSRFVETAEDRISCANDVFADTRDILMDVQNRDALAAIVGHVNQDFADYFAALNAQSQILTDRINRQLVWQDRTAVAPETNPRKCFSTSNESRRLCEMRSSMLKAHINKPDNRGRIEPAQWTPVEPPQFVVE